MIDDKKACSRCGALLPLDEFYFVSRATGTRRGQCRACVVEIKRLQRDPSWRPTCATLDCERLLERAGMGRRLCDECFGAKYDAEAPSARGGHLPRLKPCSACGTVRLREDHVTGTTLCGVCRGVPQARRRALRQYYNMTPREFLALEEAQAFVCAICRKKPRKSFNVDHQHKDPSLVRGLICTRCNNLLGIARDAIEVLRNAAAYLEKPPAQALLPGRVAHPEANRRAFAHIARRRSPGQNVTSQRRGAR